MGNIFNIMNNLKPTFKLVKNNPNMDISGDKKWEAVHWKITLNNNTFYYSEGIGLFTNGGLDGRTRLVQRTLATYKEGSNFKIRHALHVQNVHLNDLHRIVRTDRVKVQYGSLELRPPKLEDVFYSLTMDSDALEYSFSDWCDNFGYDTDSVKANTTYKLCQENAFMVKGLGFDIEKLREHYQDY